MGESPQVFISYSHDSAAHRKRVLALAERLREDGIDADLDQYVKGTPPEKWPRWMLNRLDQADFVLLVCTATYYRRFRGHEAPGQGQGVDWEGAIITQEIFDTRSNTTRFVPVLFDPADADHIPEPVRGHSVYSVDSRPGYQRLYDFLLGQSGTEARPLGVLKPKARDRTEPLLFPADNGASAAFLSSVSPENHDELADTPQPPVSRPDCYLLMEGDGSNKMNAMIRKALETEFPGIPGDDPNGDRGKYARSLIDFVYRMPGARWLLTICPQDQTSRYLQEANALVSRGKGVIFFESGYDVLGKWRADCHRKGVDTADCPFFVLGTDFEGAALDLITRTRSQIRALVERCDVNISKRIAIFCLFPDDEPANRRSRVYQEKFLNDAVQVHPIQFIDFFSWSMGVTWDEDRAERILRENALLIAGAMQAKLVLFFCGNDGIALRIYRNLAKARREQTELAEVKKRCELMFGNTPDQDDSIGGVGDDSSVLPNFYFIGFDGLNKHRCAEDTGYKIITATISAQAMAEFARILMNSPNPRDVIPRSDNNTKTFSASIDVFNLEQNPASSI